MRTNVGVFCAFAPIFFSLFHRTIYYYIQSKTALSSIINWNVAFLLHLENFPRTMSEGIETMNVYY